MKNKVLMILLVLLILIIGFVSFFVKTYNNLQTMDEKVNSNWAQVENQLKRRSDLIPNLVATVKGYAQHEEKVFTDVANARAKLSGAMNTNNVKAVQKGANDLNSALSRLLVVVERYPELKADKSFMSLQDELTGTENRIGVARKDYNDSVQLINAKIRTFPTSFVASLSSIKQREYFEVSETEKQTPKVEF